MLLCLRIDRAHKKYVVELLLSARMIDPVELTSKQSIKKVDEFDTRLANVAKIIRLEKGENGLFYFDDGAGTH